MIHARGGDVHRPATDLSAERRLDLTMASGATVMVYSVPAEASLRGFTRLGTWLGATVLVGALASACASNGETNTTGSGPSGSGGSGVGGTGGTATGGTGGVGGTPSAGMHGPGASQMVNGGDVVKSPGYKMVFTLGQPTQNQTRTTSPGYRMQGGLIGATGTLP